MTTTTEAPAVETVEEPEHCPKCGGDGKKVPQVNVWHCDVCGKTWGDPLDPVQPDDVATPGQAIEKASASAEPHPMDGAVMAMGDPMEAIPGRQEFLTMAATARMLSLSQAVPEALKNPYTAFHVVMMGRALNLDPATAINLIDVIGFNDKKPNDPVQMSLSPELLVARVKMMGLGSVELLYATKTRAAAVALNPDGYVVRASRNEGDVKIGDVVEIHGEKGRVEFNWDNANDAELVDDRCLWDQEQDVVIHWKKPGSNGRGWTNGTPNSCRCHAYRKYPGRMLGWRAMGFCVHTHFSQASLGLYSAEELGAAVDEQGRAIDPATIELPEGYEEAKAPGAYETPPALPEQVDEIKARVKALPDEHRRQFVARWAEKFNEGRLAQNVNELLASQVAIATALVNGAETNAKADGWKPGQPVAPADPPEPDVQPPAATEAPLEPTGGDPPPEPDQEPPGEPQDEVARTMAALEALSGTGDPAKQAPDGMSPELAVQYGRAKPFVSNAIMDSTVAIVKSMTPASLNTALRNRAMAVTKVPETVRRQKLAGAMAIEQATKDHEEANRV